MRNTLSRQKSAYLGSCMLAIVCLLPMRAAAYLSLKESASLLEKVSLGLLPRIEERIPASPLVVDLEAKGRTTGEQGGTLRTMVSRAKDIRQILRPGHRWSDGYPFTSADFDYWWNHVANNPALSPSGPPQYLRVEGELPVVTFPDDYTVVLEWSKPNPFFIPLLARARPPFIFRPRHYLEQFHKDFADPNQLVQEVLAHRVRSWNSLHNKLDNMYKFDNPELPTLQPWMVSTESADNRQIFLRNPYYHRIDTDGTQLPYIDKVEMNIVGGSLIPAKSNVGEADLQARGLDFNDVSILKKGELEGGNYRLLLWSNGTASQMAIYPNLNYSDPAWRTLLRDVRFRRAMSLGIDRRMINRALYFGLGIEGGMSALSASPLFDEKNRSAWAQFDIKLANQLLDEIGLVDRQVDGIRLLPDGRPLRILIETAGERQEVENALQIITDTWRDIGIELVMRPLDRDILRMRVNSGACMVSVWYGWDNGIPTANTSPEYLAPLHQEFLAWPKWGQYYQTGGKAGEPPDMEEAERLLELLAQWDSAASEKQRSSIWQEMLEIHADQQFGIGIVSETPQPIVVSKQLKNVPNKALWAWQPGAHFGVHRPDEFYFDSSESPDL